MLATLSPACMREPGGPLCTALTAPCIRLACRSAFKAFVSKIVMRRNHITGQLYRDDPAILAWDLVNEPYNPGDASGQVLRVRVTTIFSPCMARFLHIVSRYQQPPAHPVPHECWLHDCRPGRQTWRRT